MPGILMNPIPLLSKVEGSRSLSERVNIATRSLHTQLNKLILLRLPLALPPQTTNPSKYVSGLLHIAPIYITFESLWQTIIDDPYEEEEIKQKLKQIWVAHRSTSEQKRDPASDIPQPSRKTCSRIHCLLSDLQLPGLPRADTLRADIRVLTGIPEDRVQEQLSTVSQYGMLADFLSHIRSSVKSKPHVLLAYAWVLYMALFSGGRHLRAALKNAGGVGPRFWDRELSPVRPYSITHERSKRKDSGSIRRDSDVPAVPGRGRSRSDGMASGMVPGMRFFHFPGSEDGEDIKRRFKARYAEAELHLTESEKDDIVSESQHIFSFMLELISDLDLIMDTQDEDLETEWLLQQAQPLLMASRDSVCVTRERLPRQKPDDTDKFELQRKSSYLEVLVTEPIVKLIRFRGAVATWDLVIKPLGRRFSKDGSSSTRQFSFPYNKKIRNGVSQFVVEHYVATLVVLASALVALLAWYNSA